MDTVTVRPQSAANFPLPSGDLESLGFRRTQIDRLIALIEQHIAEKRYPGCHIALARHGKLALYRSFGNAVTETKPRAADDDTLWLLYSNTKVVTAVTLWALAERGLFSFSDKIADHVPEFRKNAKGNITVPRVDTAIDCGFAVNPERIRSQIEGSAVMGLTLAKYGEITFKDGRVEQGNFNDFQLVRIDESPTETRVHIVEHGIDVPASGVGEPGVPPFAPALCNAIFAATGKRLRKLPIDTTALKQPA